MKQMIDVKQISIIGLGLMGGSIALALKNRGYNGKIVGYDICRNYVDEALGSKAIDMGADNPGEAVIGAGLVIIAVPISQYKAIFNEINPFLSLGCIVTDIGSVKLEPVELAEKLLPKGIHFVGGHPMTGSERGGFNAADPFLYENAYYFLTPREDTPAEAVGIMEDLIKSLGAYAVPIAPKEHDLIVSRISHLPHIIASTLVNFMDNDKGISYLTFVGGGFRDTTRIASGNPHMWGDILFANKEKVVESIEYFQTLLDEFKLGLQHNEKDRIVKLLENARVIRNSVPHKGRDYNPPVYEVFVSIEDKPGSIAGLTQLISSYNINIKQTEILHSRQNEGGAFRLVFENKEDRELVLKILKERGLLNGYD